MAEVVKDPKSNTKIVETLRAERTKQESITILDRFLKPQTAIDLEYNFTDFPAKIVLMDNAEGIKIDKNAIAETALVKLRLHSVSYLEVINAKIKFGTYPASVRTSFLMDVRSADLPKMETHAEIWNVAEHIHTGNAALILLGLTPPLDFPASENDTLMGDYSDRAIEANTATETFTNLATVVAQRNRICRTLTTTIRKELQFHCVDMTDAAMREYLRLWGVVFRAESTTTEVDILAIYADGGAIAPGTAIRLGLYETKATKKVPTLAVQGVSGIVDAHGTLDLETTQVGDLFLICEQTGCDKLVYPITIVAGEDMSITVRLVLTPPEV